MISTINTVLGLLNGWLQEGRRKDTAFATLSTIEERLAKRFSTFAGKFMPVASDDERANNEWAEAKSQGLLDAIEVVEEQATQPWADVEKFALEVTKRLRERRAMLERKS